MNKASLIAAATWFAAATAVSAQTSAPAPPSGNSGIDQARIDQGKATFAQRCSHCHGFNMVNAGTVAPDLRRFPDDRTRFFTTVKSGRNGRMPPWADILDDDQIGSLWAYVSSRRTP